MRLKLQAHIHINIHIYNPVHNCIYTHIYIHIHTHLIRLEQVHVTCLIVNNDGLIIFLFNGIPIPNCHNSGSRIPASNNKSLHSLISAEMLSNAHNDCSLTVSSLLFDIKPIRSGKAPKSEMIFYFCD